MAVRLILQMTDPSHALTVCEPWTRILVETERPNTKGHTIGDVLRLRKTQSVDSIMITGIETKQLTSSHVAAQQYLDACAWWLHRPPFGVERLPVSLVAHPCNGSLARVEGWNVTSMDLSFTATHTLCLDDTGDLLPHLKTLQVSKVTDRALRLVSPGYLSSCDGLEVLSLCNTNIADITVLPVKTLSTLSLSNCVLVKDIHHLSGALCLTELDLSHTQITNVAPLRSCEKLRKVNFSRCKQLHDLAALAGLPNLEEIEASDATVSTITGLNKCTSLRKVDFGFCKQLRDLSPLAGLQYLEEIEASDSAVRTLTGLSACTSLRKLSLSWCRQLADLSPLAGLQYLEEIEASYSAVRTLTGLSTCTSLRKVKFNACQQLRDLSGLVSAPRLWSIDIRETKLNSKACQKQFPGCYFFT